MIPLSRIGHLKTIISSELKTLWKILNDKKETRLVGGCIRNYLLEKPIKDFDLCTKLLPEETISILEQNNIKTRSVGIKHGTVLAIVNDQCFEITTLRKDVFSDGRHSNVVFIDSFYEDAKRRDFTFNAFYLDFNGKFYDFFDGIKDLQKGLVRFIGNPNTRIQEDYLRILRFFRFYSYYGSILDNIGFQACIKYKKGLLKLSRERVKEEFIKILLSPYPLKVLNTMQCYGFLEYILEENGVDFYNLEIFFSINKYIRYDFNSLFLLILILSKNPTLDLKKSLVLSNKEMNTIKTVLRYKDITPSLDMIKKLYLDISDKNIIIQIIVLAIINNNCANYIEEINTSINYINNLQSPKLPINGNDLVDAGFTNIQAFGAIINHAKTLFINSDFRLSKTELLSQLKIRLD